MQGKGLGMQKKVSAEQKVAAGNFRGWVLIMGLSLDIVAQGSLKNPSAACRFAADRPDVRIAPR